MGKLSKDSGTMSRRGMVAGLAGTSTAAVAAMAVTGAPASAAPSRAERPWEKSSLGTSVVSYGAVGDGRTDDTAAIQGTIDTVIDQGGGSVVFPAGTYAISAPLVITSDSEWFSTSGVMLVGEGEGSRILHKDPAATHTLVNFQGPAGPTDRENQTGGYLRNCGMSHLTIGNSDNTQYDPGEWPDGADPTVVMTKTIQLAIENCIIEQPGGPALDLTDSYIGHITGNIIRLGTDGMVFHGVANALRIMNNRIQNCVRNGISIADPESSPAGFHSRGISLFIAGNDIEGNGAYAILLGDATTFEAITIISNHIESNWQTKYSDDSGPFIYKSAGGGATCTGVSIIGNRFLNFDPAEQAVVLEKGTDTTILSNSFVAAPGHDGDRRANAYRMGPAATNWLAGPTDAGSLEMDGQVRVHNPDAGIVLTSENGTAFRITVSDDGEVIADRLES